MASTQSAKYLISRYGDPLFALFIGTSAAVVRIRKEETEKRSGLPSSSMVISPEQMARMKEELELRQRSYRGASAAMYSLQDYGSSDTYKGAQGNIIRGQSKQQLVHVSYLDILQLMWERIKWRVHVSLNERHNDLVRKDGRLI